MFRPRSSDNSQHHTAPRSRGRFFSTVHCLLALLLALFFALPVRAFDPMQFDGPKVKDLYYAVIRDMDAQFLALASGRIDVLSELYRAADIERLAADPAVQLSLAPTFHSFYLTFNTRAFPWDQTVLRQAASQVLDRRRWTRDLFSGYAEPITSFLPPVSAWCSLAPAPALPFGLEAARKRLAEAGWSWNAAGRLTAPDGREVPDTEILCPPSSVVATTAEIAQSAAQAFTRLGIPTRAAPMDFQAMLARVDEGKFDACTNAWNLSRDPDLLYLFYHSSGDVPGGYNKSGISDPELDRALLELRNARDEASARRWSDEAQARLSVLMPVAPIYSRYSVTAVRSDWQGLFTSDRVTADNLWTLLAMSPTSGAMRPLYWCLPEEVRVLNPLTSSTAYDWMVLGTIYDSLISVNPETFEDLPWLAESWDVRPEGEGALLTFRLRPGLSWQDGTPLTAEDAAHTIRFIREHKVPRFYDSVANVISADAEGLTLRVALSRYTLWDLHNIGGLILLPRHILEKVSDWRAWQPANLTAEGAPTQLIGTGPFTFRESRTGEYVHMTRNEHYWLYRPGRARLSGGMPYAVLF
ncbi:MAG: ABC transporter substrate-binding protein [Fretibacterium sp.]|nr:ABC transporter substrate-binding protein [Fretibacterium sp.]